MNDDSALAAARPQVVFVDDEQHILEALRRQLHPRQREWDMHFVADPAEALTRIIARPPAVVVSDLRMPGIDGEDLLRLVAERAPGTVRMALSGYHQRELAIEASGLVHRFLAKPISAAAIEAMVAEAIDLGVLLADAHLARLLNGCGALPCQATTLATLQEQLRSGIATDDDLVQTLGADPAALALMLKIANGPVAIGGRRATCASQALQAIGRDRLRGLVLMAGWLVPGEWVLPGDRSMVLNHLVGSIAHDLASTETECKAALTALTLAEFGPTLLDLLGQGGMDAAVADRAVAYLLGLWQVPTVLVSAIADRRGPVPVDQARPLTSLCWLATAVLDGCDPETLALPSAWRSGWTGWQAAVSAVRS